MTNAYIHASPALSFDTFIVGNFSCQHFNGCLVVHNSRNGKWQLAAYKMFWGNKLLQKHT